jgi:hypothetical protein
MDILNFISWIRGRRQVTSVDPAKTLLPVGIKDPKRDDEYIAGAITVEDFATQVGGLQTVAVDGTTIVGNGTPSNPLVANIPPIPPSANIYNSNGTLTTSRTLNGGNNVLNFSSLNQFVASTASNYYYETASASQRSSVQTSLQSVDIENFHFFDNVRSFIITQKNFIGLASRNATATNGVFAKLDFNTNKIFTTNDLTNYGSNTPVGLNIEFGNRVYELGQINGFNTAKLSIKDQAAYPLQVSGINMSDNTAGAASGQFLKINVNGVDYKIALLNT